MTIHGDPALGPHKYEIYQYPNGAPVRVYKIPFTEQIRTLANECLFRFQRMNNGAYLTEETPNCDREAKCLVLTAFQTAIRNSLNADYVAHLYDLLAEMPQDEGCYLWLRGLAWDGGGLRPAEKGLRPIGDIIAPIVAQVEANR